MIGYMPAALTEKALKKGNPAFLPFSGHIGGLLQDIYAVLQAANSDLPALSLEAVINDIPGLNTRVRRAHDEAMLQTLKAMFQEQCNSESTAERIRSERNLASMHTVMDGGASKFMDAMPLVIFTEMSDQKRLIATLGPWGM